MELYDLYWILKVSVDYPNISFTFAADIIESNMIGSIVAIGVLICATTLKFLNILIISIIF